MQFFEIASSSTFWPGAMTGEVAQVFVCQVQNALSSSHSEAALKPVNMLTHTHTHARTSDQTSLNPHMQTGVRPKNNPVLPQVQLLSLLYKGKLSYPRQP